VSEDGLTRDAPASAPPRTRVRRSPSREEEIIDAAIEVFARKGYAATSVQDVADAVGLLKGSLYHYIQSKEDLLFRILDESHRQASAIVEEVSKLDVPPLERMRIYLERYVRWYLENLERVSIYFSEWRYLEGQRRETVVAQGRLYTDFLRGLIQEAQAAGDVDPEVDYKLATSFIMGAVNALPQWYRRDREGSPDTVASSYADMAIRVLVDGSTPATLGKAPAPADR
jgi:TetR/AcrR family transcriptional regulator, cholesterol catabolism regulator